MSPTAQEALPVVMPAGLRIRPFTPDDADYAAIVAIDNAVYPEYPNTVEEWRYDDETRDAKIKWARWVAEIDGQAVGFGGYDQAEDLYHPQRFWLSAAVLPTSQGRGVGRALYEQIVAALAPHQPIALRAHARADMARTLRFLQDRGYVEDLRDWESRLDLAGFDPTPYAGHEAQVLAGGITLVTLRELMARDPDYRQKLYELSEELMQDVPSSEPRTPVTRELFDRWLFENPNLLPDGYIVACDGDHYAGLSALFASQADASELYTGLTAVRRPYRRRGIALALKLRAIAYARAQGITTIKTWNESNNRAMLSINEQLGFVKQPVWISFLKHV